MGSVGMIMLDVVSAEVVEMPHSEHDEMTKTLAADRLNESLDERTQVRRAVGVAMSSDTMLLQGRGERLRELGVAVVLDGSHSQPASSGLPNEGFRLLDD